MELQRRHGALTPSQEFQSRHSLDLLSISEREGYMVACIAFAYSKYPLSTLRKASRLCSDRGQFWGPIP